MGQLAVANSRSSADRLVLRVATQRINPLSGAGEYGVDVGVGAAGDGSRDDVEPPRVGRGESSDRPIASEHAALRPERLKSVLEVGPDGVLLPASAGFARRTRQLAHHVWTSRKVCQLLAPRLPFTARDVGLAHVIEHKTDVGARVDQSRGNLPFGGPYADVEGQPKLADGADTFDEACASREAEWLILDQAPHADSERVRGERFELLGNRSSALDGRANHHATK